MDLDLDKWRSVPFYVSPEAAAGMERAKLEEGVMSDATRALAAGVNEALARVYFGEPEPPAPRVRFQALRERVASFLRRVADAVWEEETEW